jgi:putative inorganic carbon (HCO3(-)) transporter
VSDASLAARTRLPFYLLLFWLALLPWPLGANRDWLWPWFAAALMLIAALVAWRGADLRRCRSAHPSLCLALICTALWAAIDAVRALLAMPSDVLIRSNVFAVADPDAAQLGALRSLVVLVLSVLLVELVSSRRRARWLLGALFIAGIGQAVVALWLTLGGTTLTLFGHELGGTRLASGTFINRNHFAGMLELAGAAGFGLLASGLHARERAETWREWLRRFGHALLSSRFLVRLGLAVLVVAMVMTRSRMGNAAFFLGLTGAGLAAIIWWRPLPRILLWLLLSIVAVDVLVLGAWVGVDKVAERMAETRIVAANAPTDDTANAAVQARNTEPTDAERWAVAQGGLALWRQRPVLGHGAGSFRVVFPSAKSESVSLYYEHAHNDYVQALAERGSVGFLLQSVATLSLLFAAVHALRLRADSLARGLALTSLAAATAFAAHALVDFNLQIPSNQFWFQVCLLTGALALGLPHPLQRRQSALTDASDEAHDGRAQ